MKGALRTTLVWVLGALLLLLFVRSVFFATFRVVSNSMAPTLVAGDVLLVDRLAYRDRMPGRGEVIVWETGERDYVKRVIGLPGDRIVLKGRQLELNGEQLPLELVGEVELDASGALASRTRFLLSSELWLERIEGRPHSLVTHKSVGERGAGAWTVPPGHLFVIGDNRDDSIDSRSEEMGPVAIEWVLGRVQRVVLSRGEAGFRRDRFLMPVR